MRETDRRGFLVGAATAAVGASIASLASGVAVPPLPGAPLVPVPVAPVRLPPPGTRAWQEVLAACTGCGACVEACPPRALALAGGVPGFVPRRMPCALCEDTPCVAACASGALGRPPAVVTEVRMGVAELVDRKACLNRAGLRCDVCVEACPLPGQALRLGSADRLPRVDPESCTGCGRCEMACVLAEPAIRVRALAA